MEIHKGDVATLTTHLTPGYGRIIDRPTRVAVRTEQVTVLGPIPFEPNLVRVRTRSGQLLRVNREDLS